MTVPIYVTAAILAVIAAYFSDRVGKRSPFIVGFLLVMVIGYVTELFSKARTRTKQGTLLT
jgi:MFS family permease